MRISRRTFTLSAATAPIFVSLAGSAQNATPAVTDFAPAIDRLNEVLQYVPGGILDNDLDLIWNDHERQVAAIRQHAGAAAEQQPDQQVAMMSLLANGPEILIYADMLEELTGYGYDALVQTAQFGVPPNTCLVAKLNQPAEEIIPFLESVDYEPRENEYGTFWTIGETGELDLKHPVQSRLMAKHNNVAMIADDTIAYAPTSELLEQIMSTAAGDAPNRIAELESLAAGLTEDTASAWFLDGDLFDQENLSAGSVSSEEVMLRIEGMIAESDDEAGPMPVFRSVGIGVTGGGSRDEALHNPAAQEFIVLETDDADMAEQASKVIAWRIENFHSLETGEPYSELLADVEVDVIDGETLRVSRPMSIPRAILPRMVLNRDVLPFTFSRRQ